MTFNQYPVFSFYPTNYTKKELTELENKKPVDFKELAYQIALLEEQGPDYVYKNERRFKCIKTKNHRLFFEIIDDKAYGLLLIKKTGRKIENRHFEIVKKRLDELKRVLLP